MTLSPDDWHAIARPTWPNYDDDEWCDIWEELRYDVDRCFDGQMKNIDRVWREINDG